MTRRSQSMTDKQGSKKALRKGGRKIAFRGQAYVRMLRRRRMIRTINTASFVDDIFDEDLHVQRVQSLASGVLGVLHAAMLSIAVIGRTAAEVVGRYRRRFTIEETFRDNKDLYFGMGLSATHIRDAHRRDRMLMLVALAQAFLTALGQAHILPAQPRMLLVSSVAQHARRPRANAPQCVREPHASARLLRRNLRCAMRGWFSLSPTTTFELSDRHSHMGRSLGVRSVHRRPDRSSRPGRTISNRRSQGVRQYEQRGLTCST